MFGLGLDWFEAQRTKRLFETLVATRRAQDWSDDFKFEPAVLFRAATWQPPRLFGASPTEVDGWGWRLNRLPRGEGLSIYASGREGTAFFDDDVEIPVLYERRTPNWHKLWMSITPHEVLSLRPGARFATGKVVVGGLGMGWLLQKVCAKPSVTEVVVVERDAKLLDWFGRRICAEQPKVTAVHCADVWDYINAQPVDPKTRYVLDIWEHYGTAHGDPRLKWVKEVGHKVWAWGDVLPPPRYR